MVSFNLPIPVSISTGGGGGGGSGNSIVSGSSSVAFQTLSSGNTNINFTSNNGLSMIVSGSQVIVGSGLLPTATQGQLMVVSNNASNCITLVNYTSNLKNALIGVDIAGNLTFTNTGGATNINNSDLYVSNHNGSTRGLYLGSTLVTASATELNYVDVVPGNASNLKAVVLDINKNISGINQLICTSISGTMTTNYQPNINTLDTLNITTSFSLRNSEVLATATQLNYTITTPGATNANKALIVDNNKNIAGINSLSSTSLVGNIITPTQSNITLLGTLSSLLVSGNVGFGTLTPGANLEVASTNNTNSVIRITTQGARTDISVDAFGSLNINPSGNSIIFSNNKNLILGGTGSITCNSLTASTITGLLQTANQSNITTLGTLTSLVINGSLSVGLNSTTKKMEIRETIDGNCLRLSKTGSIYTDFVITSGGDLSIQPIGNVRLSASTSLILSNGNISGVTSLTATNLTGTLLTPNQPNITTIGTLTSLNVAGTIVAGGLSVTNLTGTLQTGAQPNITSIGQLTNLTVSNSITTASLTATNLTGTLLTPNQPNITSIGALNNLTINNTLTVDTVTAVSVFGTLTKPAQPNINSLGTLIGLSVSGTITTISLSATNITGTLQTSAQTNITSVGTLINLSVTGNISSGGNISGTNLIGRLQTASQPNITTIGTLSSLLVTGTASCNFLSASFITGSIQTESQPNITSVGTLVNLKTSGFIGINNSNPVKPIDIISGNGFGIKLAYSTYVAGFDISNFGDLTLTATSTNKIVLSGGTSIQFSNGGGLLGLSTIVSSTLTGTLLTPSQPNITTVGTLTSLTSTGQTFLGSQSFQSSYAVNITDTSGNFIQLTEPDGVSTIRSQNGNLVIAPASQNVVLSPGTNLVLNGGSLIGVTGISFTTLYATITNPTQPYITSLGNLSGLVVDGNVVINNTGNTSLNVSGSAQFNNSIDITGDSTLTGSLSISNNLSASNITSSLLSLTGTTDSTSLTTGALVVPGGAAIAKTLYVGTSIVLNNNILSGSDIALINNTTIGTVTSGNLFVTDSSNDLTGINNFTATNFYGIIQTSAQTNITSLGTLSSLSISGYVGIGTSSPSAQLEINNVTGNCIKLFYNKQVSTSNFGTLTISNDGTLFIESSSGTININSSIYSNSAATFNNSIYVSGNSIIDGDINVSGNLTTNTLTLSTLSLTGTNDSSSLTTGTLIVPGGAAIKKTLYVGDRIVLNGVIFTDPSITLLNNITTGTITAQNLFISDNSNDLTGVNNFTATNLYGSIKTASQPSITSVGTLNGLTVSSILNASTLVVSGGATIGQALYVGTQIILDGITLSSPSITLLNDITTGTITAENLFISDSNNDLSGVNNFTATNLYGTIKTASQQNITSVGTLNGLDVSGTISANSLSLNGSVLSSSYITFLNNISTGTVSSNTLFVTDSNNNLTGMNNFTATNLYGTTLTVSGTTSFSSSTDSTSISTGSVIITGGIAVAKTVRIGTKIIVGNTTNNTMPMEIGFTSFTYTGQYAFNNNLNGHGTISSGSTAYNYSIRALGRILCTQSIDVMSDRRMKTNIVELTDDFCNRFIQTTKPVAFNWRNGDQHKSFGYIAQDLLKAGYDDLVNLANDDSIDGSIEDDGFINPKGIKFTVSYDNIIPILAKNQKYLMDENEELKAKINYLIDIITNLTQSK